MKAPLVSVVLAVRNGLPHLRNTMDSLARQTYRNFELIVQDGASTDGTLEYLHSLDVQQFPKIDIQSSADNGIRQAYGRGIKRCNGDVLYFTASDEQLFDTSLETAVSLFEKKPDAAAIYGILSLVDQKGIETQKYTPPTFERARFLKFECSFPVAAAFFRKGPFFDAIKDLPFDEPLIAWDFDLWLRLGELFTKEQIVQFPDCFAKIISDRTSRSFRAEIWDQFSQDMCFMLDRYIDSSEKRRQLFPSSRVRLKSLYMGISARIVISFEGISPLAKQILIKAENFSRANDVPPYNTEVAYKVPLQDVAVLTNCRAQCLKSVRHWKSIAGLTANIEKVLRSLLSRGAFQNFYQRWKKWKILFYRGVRILDLCFFRLSNTEGRKKLHIKGGASLNEQWGYMAQMNFINTIELRPEFKYWLKIQMKVISGVIGICLMDGEKIEEEKTFLNSSEKIVTYFPISGPLDFSIIFRNGGEPSSVLELDQLSLVCSAKVMC